MKLQIQPTRVTCSQACIAMAIDQPVELVIGAFGDKGLSEREFYAALCATKMAFTRLMESHLWFPGYYFLTVASLNIRGGMHKIVIHQDEKYDIRVFDPSPMTKYKKDGSDLVTWSDVTWFAPGGSLPK